MGCGSSKHNEKDVVAPSPLEAVVATIDTSRAVSPRDPSMSALLAPPTEDVIAAEEDLYTTEQSVNDSITPKASEIDDTPPIGYRDDDVPALPDAPSPLASTPPPKPPRKNSQNSQLSSKVQTTSTPVTVIPDKIKPPTETRPSGKKGFFTEHRRTKSRRGHSRSQSGVMIGASNGSINLAEDEEEEDGEEDAIDSFILEALSVKDPPIARVFVSTGADLEAERKAIMERVVPKLEAAGRKVGVMVTVVDMRIQPPLTPSSPTTLLTTLREISQSTFFIGIIGESYGWIPDLNDARQVHPKTKTEYPAVKEWAQKGIGLQEMEIEMAGREERAGGRPFVYIKGSAEGKSTDDRSPPFSQADFTSVVDMTLDERTDDVERVRAWTDRLQSDSRYTTKSYYSIDELVKRIIKDVAHSLSTTFAERAKRGRYNEEAAQQWAFVNARRDVVWTEGMGLVKDVIDGAVGRTHDEDGVALPGRGVIVTGPPGRGKSTLLANWVLQCTTSQQSQPTTDPRPPPLILPHFISASTLSRDPIHTLRTLSRALATHFPTHDPSTFLSLPSSDPAQLFSSFAQSLTQSSSLSYRQIIILLDGADDFLDVDGAHELDFLPHPLPENIVVVLSADGESLPVAQGMDRGWDVVPLNGCLEDERRNVLKRVARRVGVDIDEEIVDLVCGDELSEDPMYIEWVVYFVKAWRGRDEKGGEFEREKGEETSESKSEEAEKEEVLTHIRTMLEGGIPNLITTVLRTYEDRFSTLTLPEFSSLCSNYNITFPIDTDDCRSSTTTTTTTPTKFNSPSPQTTPNPLPPLLSLLHTFTFAGTIPLLTNLLSPHFPSHLLPLIHSLSPGPISTASGLLSFSHELVREAVEVRYLQDRGRRERLAQLVSEWLMGECLRRKERGEWVREEEVRMVVEGFRVCGREGVGEEFLGVLDGE
ncbi:hypothetical protein HDV00_004882 [Rhizophlyctis rosea]|nr:hypothetical protein HDV00_004882 [Rhizophlyctis rosea]